MWLSLPRPPYPSRFRPSGCPATARKFSCPCAVRRHSGVVRQRWMSRGTVGRLGVHGADRAGRTPRHGADGRQGLEGALPRGSRAWDLPINLGTLQQISRA